MPHRPLRARALGACLLVLASATVAPPAAAQWPSDDATPTELALAMNAKLLCSAVFFQNRDAETHIARDLRPFAHFGWENDFSYEVDRARGRVTLRAPGVPARVAQHNGDQGCAILPRGALGVSFQPSKVRGPWEHAEHMEWPTGELIPEGPLPPEVDAAALDRALDWGMDNAQHGQNTRALVVVYEGRLIGERYAPGFAWDTPHLSWSEGKSITAALVGILVQQGELTVDQPAPIAEWRAPGDARAAITVADLMHMSSGLDFQNLGLAGPETRTPENHHFRIYFDGIDVFRHATSFPLAVPPNTRWRYLNSDPLTLGRIVREKVEARGESYHAFPWKALFDKIGMKGVVLETDAWGNFIMTGFDYASARDWARFGLLHLQDGVWAGQRILPAGWSRFVSTPAPASENQGYGALFWLNAGGAYERIPRDAYWPSGFMGQTTMIIPSREMVIVRLGPSPGRFGPYLNRLVGDMLDAVRPSRR